MRRRILGVAVASAVLAVVIFAVPLAIAARALYSADEQGELERVALSAAVNVGPKFASGDPAELPSSEPGDQLGLYDADGTRVGGTGPAQADDVVTTALGGSVGESDSSGWTQIAVPVAADEQVVGAVRAATPSSTIWKRATWTWASMLAVAILAIVSAVLLADVLARRLSRPINRLALAAQRLGDGDFDVAADQTGIPEIDRASSALTSTSRRLGHLVSRERLIAANASHQLRTPLTGLRASLEQALADPKADLREAARGAIESADVLESTIEDLIGLTRGDEDAGVQVSLGPPLETAQRKWNGALAERGRPLRLQLPDDLPPVRASAKAIAQILDVLLENSLRHGEGAVTISARTSGSAVAVDVADNGPGVDNSQDVFQRGVSGSDGAGIGLSFAREIAEDQGGRLLLTQRKPSACFTLLLAAKAAPKGAAFAETSQ